jgi:hypothetical protein
MPRSAPAG